MNKQLASTMVGCAVVLAGLVATPAATATESIGKYAFCPAGTSQITYTPGVTNTEQTVYETGLELSGPCSILGYTGLSSFYTTFAGEVETSCTSLLSGSGSGEQTFIWNDGKKSYWTYTSIITQDLGGNAVVTLRGPISADSDYFAGGEAVQVVIYANLNPTTCSDENPLTTQSGTSTYTITG